MENYFLSLPTTFTLVIVLVCVVAVGLLIFALLGGYRVYTKTIHIYAKPTVVQGNADTKLIRVSENPQSAPALQEFENAKMLFFKRALAGPADYYADEDWALKPDMLEAKDCRGKKMCAYYFSPDNYNRNTSYSQKTISAKKFEDATGDKWIVLLHAYDGSGLENYKIAYQFIKRGYNVLSPDLIGHGKDSSKYVSFGYYDSKNIATWIKRITKQNKNAQIVLFGQSMGAATALQTTEYVKHERVKCVVADSSFTILWNEVRHLMQNGRKKTPVFPYLYMANFFCKLLAGFNMKKVSPLDSVKDNTIPTFFIHGGQDRYTLPAMTQELYDNSTCEKQIKIFDGAGHTQSLVFNFNEYFELVDDFISNHLD